MRHTPVGGPDFSNATNVVTSSCQTPSDEAPRKDSIVTVRKAGKLSSSAALDVPHTGEALEIASAVITSPSLLSPVCPIVEVSGNAGLSSGRFTPEGMAVAVGIGEDSRLVADGWSF